MKSKKSRKNNTLTRQRVRRKRKPRPWVWGARVLGSAVLRITVLIGVVATVSTILIYCYQFVTTSSFFALKHLIITGVGRHNQEDIVKLCALRKGENLLALKLNQIRTRLEKDPWIRSARVERMLPDTLRISVVREEPCAIVRAEKLYYMNRWGEIFKEVARGEPVNLPVVTGLADLGSEAREQLRQVASFIEILKTRKGAINFASLSEVHIDSTGHFSVYFTGVPAEIQMGLPGLELQLAKLDRLISHLKKTGKIHEANRIDLEYPGGAVVSFRPGYLTGGEG